MTRIVEASEGTQADMLLVTGGGSGNREGAREGDRGRREGGRERKWVCGTMQQRGAGEIRGGDRREAWGCSGLRGLERRLIKRIAVTNQ